MGEFYVINDNAEIVEVVDDEQDVPSYWEDAPDWEDDVPYEW